MRRHHFFFIYGALLMLCVAVGYLLLELRQTRELIDERAVVTIPNSDVKILLPEPKLRVFEIPEKLTFAGENVPLAEGEVRERFERELYVNAYWESNMLLLMKRSAKYLPTIERILRENGIPEDFKYLAMAESGLQNVVSPAGARGFWQIMPGTAKDYKLEVNDEVDERYHLEKSTQVACKYFRSAFARFGNWTSVAASYNMGIAGLSKRKEEQRFTNYYDLFLNEETSRYVFRILAFKEIFENPQKYGFDLSAKDLYEAPLYRELKVDQSIPSLSNWAIRHSSSYKKLKQHNPWLRSTKLTVKKGQSYIIKLPLD